MHQSSVYCFSMFLTLQIISINPFGINDKAHIQAVLQTWPSTITAMCITVPLDRGYVRDSWTGWPASRKQSHSVTASPVLPLEANGNEHCAPPMALWATSLALSTCLSFEVEPKINEKCETWCAQPLGCTRHATRGSLEVTMLGGMGGQSLG